MVEYGMNELSDLRETGSDRRESIVRSLAFGGFYRALLVANLVGFGTIAVLNVLTPLDFFRLQRAFLRGQKGWHVILLFWLLAVPLAFLVLGRTLEPLRKVRKVLRAESGVVPQGMLERTLRRVLNLPLISALANLALWIIVPMFFVSYLRVLRAVSLADSLFLFSRTFMIGIVAAGLSFFLTENCLRRSWIPFLFPNGRLGETEGALRVPILRRIRVLWGAGTLNPMIVLMITLLFIATEIGVSPPSAEELAHRIFVFALALCSIFIVIALGLNHLVGKSIRVPLGEMLKVLKRVRDGDFTQRITVVSNDEIGVLGDAANSMIHGLAERERIRETFGRYVTPEIRDRILSGRIPLGGEKRMATLLFTDLRDFTSYVEETPPEEVIRSVRAYFTVMQRVIRQHRGLVLQFVGDEIEAVFGVPIASESHADDAIRAALAMRSALRELNRARSEDGMQPFRHGIGIHTGVVLAGNTGSEDQLSYAVIGDTVNLASRLQDLTKTVQWDILVGEETVKTLKDSFDLRREIPVFVKGYSKSITAYSVIA
jgi:adenylate cyclase